MLFSWTMIRGQINSRSNCASRLFRVLLLLLFPLCSQVRRARLRIEAMCWIFVEELARDVGPELLEDAAECAFAGDNQAIVDSLAPACCIRWVIEIRNGAGNDVAADVG